MVIILILWCKTLVAVGLSDLCNKELVSLSCYSAFMQLCIIFQKPVCLHAWRMWLVSIIRVWPVRMCQPHMPAAMDTTCIIWQASSQLMCRSMAVCAEHGVRLWLVNFHNSSVNKGDRTKTIMEKLKLKDSPKSMKAVRLVGEEEFVAFCSNFHLVMMTMMMLWFGTRHKPHLFSTCFPSSQ